MLLRSWLAVALLAGAFLDQQAQGSEPGEPNRPDTEVPPNLTSPTLGGKQLWSDELFFHGWRIQRNFLTKHCRLLDDKDQRQAWGTFEQCLEHLDRFKAERKLPPMRGKVVIVIHGMFRTSFSMKTLCATLREKGDFEVLPVDYPSTRGSVADHAKSVASIVEHLGPEVEEIDFVAHSLGNLVIRYYLGDQTSPATGRKPDPRIRRIVMLAPPNHAPQRARLWADNAMFSSLYHFVLPETGNHLAAGFAELEPRLAIPACEFGILAGGKGDGQGWHSGLDGDDDGTVTVEETRLAGACDFAVLPVRHTFIMNDAKSLEYTLRFLESGCFVSDAERKPIVAVVKTTEAKAGEKTP